MIYGYVDKIVDESFGLAQMREISISAPSESLRALAKFLQRAADDLDAQRRSVNWHLHVPDDLSDSLGCEFIVLAPDDGNRLDEELPVVDL